MTEEITNDNWHRRHSTMRCDDKNVINNKISSFSHSTPELKIFLPVITCNNFSLFSHFPAFTTHHLWWWQIPAIHTAKQGNNNNRSLASPRNKKTSKVYYWEKSHSQKILLGGNSMKKKTRTVAWCVRWQTAKRESRNRGKISSLHGTTGEKPENLPLCAAHCLHQHIDGARVEKWASNTREALVLV